MRHLRCTEPGPVSGRLTRTSILFQSHGKGMNDWRWGGRITDHYVNGLLKIAEKAIPAMDKVEL